MKSKKLTYEDFEIGQKVVCCESETYDKEQLYDIWMTVGKTYTIIDLDFHFWDKICVKTDNKSSHGTFLPIECFVDAAEMIRITREKKLKRICK